MNALSLNTNPQLGMTLWATLILLALIFAVWCMIRLTDEGKKVSLREFLLFIPHLFWDTFLEFWR